MKAKLLFIISMFFSGIVFAQNVKTVDYNFAEQTLSGLLPFDQHFVINVTNLQNVENLTLKIYEIKKYNYKKLLEEKGLQSKDALSFDIIKQNVLSFVSKEFTRQKDFINDVCKIQVTAYLQPNSRYVLEFSSQKLTPLTDEQKTELETALKNDTQIQNLLNDEISKNSEAGAVLSSTMWKSLTAKLNRRANDVVHNVNADYVIKGEIDNQALINTILINNIAFINRLHVIINRYQEGINDSLISKVHDNRTNVLNRLTNDSLRIIQMLRQAPWMNMSDENIDWFMDVLKKMTNKKLIADTSVANKIERSEADFRSKLKSVSDASQKFIESFLDLKLKTVYLGTGSGSTYSPDFVVRAKQHVTFDAGYAYVWGIDRGNAYVGMNIYFRGVDTSLPLKNYRGGLKDYLGSRLSLLIGLSIESIQKDSVRKGLLGNGSALITGVGFKLLPWFKVNGGAYMYYKYPENPLYDKKRLSFTASPFVSLSIDVNLSSLINSFSNGNIFKQF